MTDLTKNQQHGLLTVKAGTKGGAHLHYLTAHALERRGLVGCDYDPDAAKGLRWCWLTTSGLSAALRLQGYGR